MAMHKKTTFAVSKVTRKRCKCGTSIPGSDTECVLCYEKSLREQLGMRPPEMHLQPDWIPTVAMPYR